MSGGNACSEKSTGCSVICVSISVTSAVVGGASIANCGVVSSTSKGLGLWLGRDVISSTPSSW